MSPGFMVMTWKQRSNLHSGRAKHPPDPKKLAKFDPKSRCCSQFFFDASGVVHHEYLPEGSTVNQAYYIEVLKRLRDAIQRKRPELWRGGRVETGFSIMTTLQPIQPSELVSFWPNIPSLFFPTPLTHLTLLYVTSFCSPCSKDLWKEEDLKPFQRLRQMRRRSSRAIKKKRT